MREQSRDRISGRCIAEKSQKTGEQCARHYEKSVLPLNSTFHVKFRTFPLYWMLHNKKIQDYYNAVQAEKLLKEQPKFPGFVVPSVLS